jgi:hypothetical protein
VLQHLVLDGQHVDGGRGLARRERAHPVDGRRRGAQAAQRERVAEPRQHRAHRREQPGVGGVVGRDEVLGAVGREQHAPVLGVGRHPVLLAQLRAARQRHQAGAHQAQGRPGQLGLVGLEVAPRELLPVLTEPPLGEAAAQPLGERQRAGRLGDQLDLQVGEPGALPGQPGVLVVGGGRDVEQLLEGGELAGLDHGRGRHRDVAAAEQVVVQGPLPGRHLRRRRGGQAEHPGVRAERLDQAAAQRPPGLEQVVALVEHQRPGPGRGGPLDERAAVGVQQREQVGPGVAPHGGRRRAAVAGVVSSSSGCSSSAPRSQTLSAW